MPVSYRLLTPFRREGPAPRRENLENYIKRLEKLEEGLLPLSTAYPACYAIQAGREVRIMVKPEVVNDERMVLLARDICKRSRTTWIIGQIKVNIIRESRAIEYAK